MIDPSTQHSVGNSSNLGRCETTVQGRNKRSLQGVVVVVQTTDKSKGSFDELNELRMLTSDCAYCKPSNMRLKNGKNVNKKGLNMRRNDQKCYM